MFFSKEDKKILEYLYEECTNHRSENKQRSHNIKLACEVFKDYLVDISKKLNKIDRFMEDADQISKSIDSKVECRLLSNLKKYSEIEEKINTFPEIEVNMLENGMEFIIPGGNITLERHLCITDDNQVRGSKFIIQWKE